MKFYTSGDKNKPVILLIPGTCCHWTFFQDVIPRLNECFYTVTVSFDGFDETEETIYPTMDQEAEKIEAYISGHFNGHILCCYGSSLGGSYAAYLTQRQNIHIDHVIIGSSDMDEAGKLPAAIESHLITPIKHGIDVPETAIHVFYALGMGKKYEKRYLTYFAHPDIRRQNLNHETFLFCYPDQWAGEVEDCCGMK